MSSLEMLPLLELAQGHPPIRGQAAQELLRPTIRRLIAFGKRSLLVLALLALWEAVPRLGLADAAFLPPFSDVIAAGWQLAQSGELYDDVAASLLRALSGFLISVALIVPLGLVVGWYTRLGDLFNQFIEVCRNTAPLALLPVFILLLGIGRVVEDNYGDLQLRLAAASSIRLRPSSRSIRSWSNRLGPWVRALNSSSARSSCQRRCRPSSLESAWQAPRPCWCWSRPKWSAPKPVSVISLSTVNTAF